MRRRLTKARAAGGVLILIFAVLTNALGQGTAIQGRHRLSWPGKNWSLDVSLAPFTAILEEFLEYETGYSFIATLNSDKQTLGGLFPVSGGLPILSIRLDAARVTGSDTDFRDYSAKTLKKSEEVDAASVKTFEYKQIPLLRYARAKRPTPFYPMNPPPPGASESAGRGLEAFFVRDGVLITFRLNALALKKEDEKLFYAVLDSVRFTDTSTASSSFDYLFKGKALIRQKQYAEAAANLNLALGLEQKQRQLDDANWRSLIGHLLDIYSAVGDRARVKTLLDYGVGNDPTSPVFHLGLAYYYAAQGNMDNTLAALEKAYSYRKNDRQTAGWAWIDPLSHPAFEGFRKDEKFRKAAKAMKR